MRRVTHHRRRREGLLTAGEGAFLIFVTVEGILYNWKTRPGHVDKILALLFPKDPVIPYWAPGVSMSPYALWAP